MVQKKKKKGYILDDLKFCLATDHRRPFISGKTMMGKHGRKFSLSQEKEDTMNTIGTGKWR